MNEPANPIHGALRHSRWMIWCPLFVLLIIHTALQYPHISLDYWNDELYTLEHFAFRPASQIAGDYHTTNNHIFFSLLTHVWMACLGFRNVDDAIGGIVAVRLLPFLLSVFTLILVYKTANRLAGLWASILAAVVLLSTMPFYNYACQLRGYGLSMCLAALLGWAIVRTYQRPSLISHMLIGLVTSLSLYTLPSNAYFILSVLVTVIVAALLLGGHNRSVVRRGIFVALSVLSGVVVAAVAYWPMLSQMSALPIFSTASNSEPMPMIRQVMPVVAYHFLSARYFLLPVMLAGAWLIARRDGSKLICLLLAMVVLFAVPFALSDLRHSLAPYRVFLTSLPPLSVIVGLLLCKVIESIIKAALQFATVLLMCGYCFGVFLFQLQKVDAKALRDIAQAERSGDLYFQYNLRYFQPNEDARAYMHTYATDAIPLVEKCRMDAEILKYLSRQGWDRELAKSTSLATVLSHSDTVDVLTETASVALDSAKLTRQPWMARQLLPGQRPVQIIRLMRLKE